MLSKKVDVLILGGGLAGALTALRFQTVKPGLTVALLEQKDRLAGAQTWTFHETDLPPGAIDQLKPFVTMSWDRTSVRFPRMEKTVEGRFHLVRSDQLHAYVMEKIGSSIVFNTTVDRATEDMAILSNGNRYDADLVIDARGFAAAPAAGLNGFHKYVSYDLELEAPHGMTVPLLMDATCPQLDGYRYFVCLPLGERTVIVQETYYSNGPELNTDRISRSIDAYAERNGWKIVKRDHPEMCSLPMPLTSVAVRTSEAGEPIPIGARGGYFHATTTNPLPDAVKVADFLTAQPEPTTPKIREALVKFRRPWLSRQKFYRLLNRFLFFASEPSLRYLVLQNLYEQPTDVVTRYTGGRTSWADRLRIISSRPPLPLDLTMRSLTERAVLATRSTPSPEA